MTINIQGDLQAIDWAKVDGMLPAIVQDSVTRQILMLGYMNPDALAKTIETGRVTFFSRTRHALWTKGETSGNFLELQSMFLDCDLDTVLILARPNGPTCHTGAVSCFDGDDASSVSFLSELAALIHDRNVSRPEGSYTTSLFELGKSRISQKVGEEGVELALAHMDGDREQIIGEAADLIYHTMVLLEHAGIPFDDICTKLKDRHIQK
ncbi:MAG: bifunctional phosphoribosyl-AMP cyclohydrolase/phosphoribosyl-ATP diphosphatase HisIE [Alphaproteobacteria bacterium]|jgi:phosphoribosyl-ATP pyrophosphohydrolase/phosphoribosyl-AMP cyclohydrolase|nr:bifunctional phosphoribosyl-AMP cyclohydrolase/phosphoribosyl-ATP diphosphatase HisIE [Alphaproteobacteria bacterium]MCB1551124.1 bifunctional phosphoribosyl-AMP cyclohydrolase/phosphoribosyl-ATP diphosphatase HisIE [Alphaproteobacteria bacterium]MCB9985043.1 bifunctional phosphoribosyl-AMP cyclohydrolase/phosphoribosyl-ATP diphosphatase HisIE [Micavibrio sp.]HRK97425.1 bifunctional phosphoribosyl-AMP cyclohydrolase/phosphoribosyl-ATP diphosphatase HisIE [Alphaproteobacteria bacterium]